MTRAGFEQVLERLQANPVLPSFALMHELVHYQRQLWRQIGGKAAKAIKQSRKRKLTLARAQKEAANAGLTVTGVEYKPDGTITYHTGKQAPDIGVSVNDNDDDGPSIDPGWH